MPVRIPVDDAEQGFRQENLVTTPLVSEEWNAYFAKDWAGTRTNVDRLRGISIDYLTGEVIDHSKDAQPPTKDKTAIWIDPEHVPHAFIRGDAEGPEKVKYKYEPSKIEIFANALATTYAKFAAGYLLLSNNSFSLVSLSCLMFFS